MVRLVFVVSFAIALALQGWGIVHIGMYDLPQWGNEPQYIEHGDARAFDGDLAYGQPGGTLIIGAGALEFAGVPSMPAIEIFLAFADALIIALIVALCYALRGSLWWSAAAGVILAADPLYLQSTPPSALASLLFALFALLTLRVLERGSVRWLTAWGICAGLLIATRFDIGLLAAAVLGAFLAFRIGARALLVPALYAIIAFIAADPFMWFMPLRHLSDMAGKFIYHYASNAVPAQQVSLVAALGWSAFAIAGILCAVAALRSSEAPVPRAFAFALLALSALGCAVILSSSYHAIRYLQPFILLWEVLLPLYILRFATPRIAARILVSALMLYPAGIYAAYAF